MIRAYGASDAGRVRKVNEDRFVSDIELRLFAVADGMGGHQAGEVASQLAIEALTAFIKLSVSDNDLTWPYGIDPKLTFDGNRLRTGICLANRRVFRAAESSDDYAGMGTTMVSMLLNGPDIAIGSVGDSRLYLLSKAGLQQLTVDDSWAAKILAQDPTLRPEEISHHPMRNVLTNVLGARETVDVSVIERRLSPGDVLLLCSDGLHGTMQPSAILHVLKTTRPGGRAAHAGRRGPGPGLARQRHRPGHPLRGRSMRYGPGEGQCAGQPPKGDRTVSDRGADRPRGHGRGLRGGRRAARSAGRGQADARGLRFGARHARAVLPRGAHHRPARASQHRHGVRSRRGAQSPLHRDGTARRAAARRAPAGRRVAVDRRQDRHHDAGLRRAAERAPLRRDPSRPEAEQPVRAAGRQRQDSRLRRGAADGVESHRERISRRHARVHVAGAAAGPAGRRAVGRLLGGVRVLFHPRRPLAVRGARPAEDARRHPLRDPAAPDRR